MTRSDSRKIPAGSRYSGPGALSALAAVCLILFPGILAASAFAPSRFVMRMDDGYSVAAPTPVVQYAVSLREKTALAVTFTRSGPYVQDNPPSFRRSLAGRLGRLAVYGALFIAIGAIGISLFVVPRLRMAKFAEGDAFPMVLDGMALSVGVVAGFLLVFAIVTRTLLQYRDSWMQDTNLSLVAFLSATQVGRALFATTVLGALVAISSAAARTYRTKKMWRVFQVLGVVLFVFFWASSGHSADAASFLGIRADVILVMHVLSVGLWMGMLAVIFVTVLPVALRDTARLPLLRATVLSFSGTALASVGVFVLTGLINARIYLGSVSNLTTTLYGKTLLLKLALVAAILGAGAYNWRVLRPRLHSVSDGLRLRSAIRLDLVLGALVLVITAVLVATTPAR